MIVKFKLSELTKVLETVMRAVPKSSSTNQALLHLLIRVNKDDMRVDINASSVDMSIRRTLFQLITDPPVVIEESGECLVLASELSDLVKKANLRKQEHVTFAGTATRMKFAYGESEYDLPSLEPRLFTAYEGASDDTTMAIVSASDLYRLLKRTTYATGDDEKEDRVILTGVNLSLVDNHLIGVSTNQHVLAKYTTHCQSTSGEDRNITIPAKQLKELVAALPGRDDDEEVTVVIGPSSLKVTWNEDEIRMVMRGLQGNYPDVDRIIPTNPPDKVVVNRQELLVACEALAVVSNREHQRAIFTFGALGIVLTANSAQYGNGREPVNIISSTLTSDLSFEENINYWIATLRSYEGIEQVEIGFRDAALPRKIQPAGEDGVNMICQVRNIVHQQNVEAAS